MRPKKILGNGVRASLWILALITVALGAQAGDPNTANAEKVNMAIDQVFTTDPPRVNNQVQAGIGSRIRVKVDKLAEAVKNDNLDPHKLVLYLDGLELKGLYGTPIDISTGTLEYYLERNEKSKAAWNTLLGSSKRAFREVTVSVGPEGATGISGLNSQPPPTMNLRIYYRRWLYGVTIVFILCLIVFFRRAKTTNMLRDANPPFPPEGKMKPYSLGRTQMAFWFFLVIGSFIYMYLVTGDYNTITDQALILIGIGTGTALGSAAIDSNKRTTADNELYTLLPDREKLNAEVEQLRAKQTALGANAARTAEEETDLGNIKTELPKKASELSQLDKKIADIKSTLEKPVSEGLISDLLSDSNGPSFHRYQIVIWTIVLGVLFIIGVYQTLSMPEFSATLLALMGISSGTYLGFKIPERQTDSTQT